MGKKSKSGEQNRKVAPPKTSSFDWKPYLILFVLTAVLYFRVVTCEFITFDDQGYVEENLQIQKGFTWDSITWAFTSGYAANWHPLTWLTHMLDYQLYGLEPWGHHFTNYLFHIANTLLVFAFFRRATQRPWPSLIVALIFALHPLHVESVAWVSERKDVLSAFFGLLALNAYVSYAASGRWSRYGLTMLLFALGLMSKPMLVTLPFVFLLLDVWPLKRVPADIPLRDFLSKAHVRLLLEKVPLIALSAISSIVTVWAQHGGGAVANVEQFPLIERVQNTFAAYLHYAWATVYPSRSAIFYPYPHGGVATVTLIVAVLCVVGGTVAVLFLRRRAPWTFTGWFWFLGMLVPVIGLVQVGGQAYADRYMYLPIIGLSILAVFSLERLSVWGRKIAVVAAVPWFVLASVITFLQIGAWQNSERLWTNALKVTKNNGLAYQALGNLCVDNGGAPEKAVELYRKGAELGDTGAQYNLGLSYAKGYGVEKDIVMAARYYEAAAQNGEATAQFNLAYLYVTGEGVEKDMAKAVQWYRKAAEQNVSKAQFNLGQLYMMGDGVAKDLGEAVKWFRRAADQGDDLGQLFLARMLESGEAGQKDLVEAYMWFDLAGKTNDEAKAARDNLAAALTPPQIAEAQQRARKWKALIIDTGFAKGKPLGVAKVDIP